MAVAPESAVAARIEKGERRALYLVTGEALLAEAAGRRIATALAGAEDAVQVHHRPEGLKDILADLRTFSLFGGAKVVVVVESAVLSDRDSAAYLIEQAAEGLPVGPDDELTAAGRHAAGRLLQACRLFGLDPFAAPAEEVVAQLPDSALAGGVTAGGRSRRKKRSKSEREELARQLAALLDAAAREELQGWAESDAADLETLARQGLPERHALVLCEVAVDARHPLCAHLRAEGALVELTTVEAGAKGGWEGLDDVAAELERETGAAIERDALAELARRTLKRGSDWGSSRPDADSAARFAAEYRKLASLAEQGSIGVDLVTEVTRDRGEADVFAMLDAIGEGRSGDALDQLRRALAAADDEMRVRLGLFAQLAGFARRLAVVGGVVEAAGLPWGERSYSRFKARIAPRLAEGRVPDADEALFARKVHPFPLHRAYLAAGRLGNELLAQLPGRLLETELQLKGESDDADAALTSLVVWLATAKRSA